MEAERIKKKVAEKKRPETVYETMKGLEDVWTPNKSCLGIFHLHCSGFMNNNWWTNLNLETKLQFLVVAWVKACYPDVFMVHCPNEGKRTKWEQWVIKHNGLREGMPDLMIYEKGSMQIVDDNRVFPIAVGFIGLAIELKILPNKIIPSQKECLDKLSACGWKTIVCYDFPTTIETIKNYLDHG